MKNLTTFTAVKVGTVDFATQKAAENICYKYNLSTKVISKHKYMPNYDLNSLKLFLTSLLSFRLYGNAEDFATSLEL